MKCGSQIAVSLVAGYLLGRSRKTRLTALLALLAASGAINPGELLRRTPFGEPLEKITGDLRAQLTEAGMTAATKTVSGQIGGLSDKLHERTEALRGHGRGGGEEAGGSRHEERAAREPERREEREPERGEYEDEYEGEEEYGEEYGGGYGEYEEEPEAEETRSRGRGSVVR